MVVSQLHSTRHLQTMSLCLFAKLILPDPQLAQEQHKLERLENRKKYLEKGERTKRTHRLCNEAMLNIVEG